MPNYCLNNFCYVLEIPRIPCVVHPLSSWKLLSRLPTQKKPVDVPLLALAGQVSYAKGFSKRGRGGLQGTLGMRCMSLVIFTGLQGGGVLKDHVGMYGDGFQKLP